MGSRFILALILATVLGFAGQSFGAETKSGDAAGQDKWIISSGMAPPLPAGSLLALAQVLERGAEAVWLDLVMTKDDHLILLSDTRLEQLSDIQEIYPDRSGPDGSYHSFDFTLEELRTVTLNPPAFSESPPAPLARSHLAITSLDDFLGYLSLVNNDLETPPTLIFILRQGWRHQQDDKDLGRAVLEALENYLSSSAAESLVIGSYDPEELEQLAHNAGQGESGTINFMQLIGPNDGKEVQRLEFGAFQPYNYDLLFTRFGLKSVSSYADTIGLDPEIALDPSGALSQPRFLEDAHILGLRVICCRADSIALDDSGEVSGPEMVFDHLLFTIGFDGIVTSRDRLARNWLGNLVQKDDSEQNGLIDRLIDRVEESGGETPDPGQLDATR